jgi:hypothetical protein
MQVVCGWKQFCNQAQAYKLFQAIFGSANVPHQPQQIA